MAESISIHVVQCLTLFRALAAPVDGTELNFPDPGIVLQVSDEESRFKVWAGNIGAHKTGMSSLDFRLRDASHIKSQVINLLKDLIQLLQDASAIAKGEQIPWDDEKFEDLEDEEMADADADDGLPDTELGQIVVGMADVTTCLLSLTMAIRNPAPHDRYIKTQSVDTSHFETYDIRHVRSKFDKIEPWLADRLGKAISSRRQYFKYRQSHHEKLAQGLDLDADKNLEAETVASSIPTQLKDDHAGSSQARLLIHDDDGSDAGMSQTSYATSTGGLARLTIPPLPDEAHARPFQCCFCYTMIVARDRATWK